MLKVLKDKKGFSLLEAVISIAIVILFSVTTLGVIISGTKIYAKNEREIRLLKELELFETCFDTTDFVSAALYARDVTLSDTGRSTVYYDADIRVTAEEYAEYVLVIDITDNGTTRTLSAYTGSVGGHVYYEMPQPYTRYIS